MSFVLSASQTQKNRYGSGFVEKTIAVIPRSEATWESVILMLQTNIRNENLTF